MSLGWQWQDIYLIAGLDVTFYFWWNVCGCILQCSWTCEWEDSLTRHRVPKSSPVQSTLPSRPSLMRVCVWRGGVRGVRSAWMCCQVARPTCSPLTYTLTAFSLIHSCSLLFKTLRDSSPKNQTWLTIILFQTCMTFFLLVKTYFKELLSIQWKSMGPKQHWTLLTYMDRKTEICFFKISPFV